MLEVQKMRNQRSYSQPPQKKESETREGRDEVVKIKYQKLKIKYNSDMATMQRNVDSLKTKLKYWTD